MNFDWVARAIKRKPRLHTERRDGLLWVSDGTDTLAITSEKRLSLYEYGIAMRIRRLARHYGLDKIGIEEEDLVVNFGANIGELALALFNRGATVLAIEPDPAAVQCLTANLAGSSATVIPVGLWQSDGEQTFFQRPETADTSAINQVGEAITAPVTRLDTLLSEHRGAVRLLIGDAEGAEPEVLRGATGVLNRIDTICLDCGPERNGHSTFDMCIEELKPFPFVVRRRGKHLVAIKR